MLRYLAFFYECYGRKILRLFLFLFVAKKLFPCFPCYAALELLFSSASYYPMQGKQHVLNFLLNVFYSLQFISVAHEMVDYHLHDEVGRLSLWANGKKNSRLVNFIPESRMPLSKISSFYLLRRPRKPETPTMGFNKWNTNFC